VTLLVDKGKLFPLNREEKRHFFLCFVGKVLERRTFVTHTLHFEQTCYTELAENQKNPQKCI
jgi:hypothetical protein